MPGITIKSLTKRYGDVAAVERLDRHSSFSRQGGNAMIPRSLCAIVAVALGILPVPPAADALEPTKVPRIGILSAASPESPVRHSTLDTFRQALRELGYAEGQNIALDYQFAEGRWERLSGLATELVRLRVDIILAAGTPSALAAKQATGTIPIVAAAMGDPVGDGLVASLARPGGNITGTTFLGPELVAKRLGLLKEALPRVSRVAALWHPGAYAKAR